MEQYLQILGKRVSDRITGFAGIASTVSFDLYGCVQVIVTPEKDKDGKLPDSMWFDHKRLEVESEKRVMPIPVFENEAGGSKLSIPKSLPLR